MKQAQVSLWVIMALFLIVLLFITLKLQEPIYPRYDPTFNKMAAQSIFKSCADDISQKALLRYAKQTGQLYPVNPVHERMGLITPYSLTPKSQNLISFEESLRQLGQYISEEIRDCVSGYSQTGANINPGQIKSEILVDEAILMKITDSTTFNQGENFYSVDPLTYSFDLPLKEVYQFVKGFHELHSKSTDLIPISEITKYCYENDVTYTLIELTPLDVIYEFKFPFEFEHIPFRFNYLVKLGGPK